jgi:UDP-3-O-[3-hydroxymyristoyl] N-acetylglucosamine deacetylase
MLSQRTLKKTVKTVGIGLHSGKKVELVLRPAAANTGIVFRRVDLDPIIDIKANVEMVGETVLSTTLVKDGAKVSTIEHIMSAFAGLGIDNAYVDVDAVEIPIMDGSAAPFVFLIQSAGIEAQSVAKKFINILKPIKFKNESGWAELTPYDGFKIDFEIDFAHPAVQETPQFLSLDLSNQSYSSEISRARTFGFMHDIEFLRSKNMCLGGSLANAIVLDNFRILNQDGLRYKDEFVKHKMLDAIGDLYTIGYGIIGAYYGYKSGHAINNMLLRELLTQQDAWEIITIGQEEKAPASLIGHYDFA